MAETVKTIQKSARGESQSSLTAFEGTQASERRQTPGKSTRTRKPVTTTTVKPGTESIRKADAREDQQEQTEDLFIDVTFKMNIKNFLGNGRGC